MGEVLGLPVRTVHVAAGPGQRGEARRSLFTQVQRGETTEMNGRPEDVLATLVQSPAAELSVLGARQRPRRPGARRVGGTAIAVARRVTRPLLLVPPDLKGWDGPRRALSLLDGTGPTAMTAASALASVSRPDTVAAALHFADLTGHPHAFGDDEMDVARQVAAHGTAAAVAEVPVTRTGTVAQLVLDAVAGSDCDLVVLVWSRRTRGEEGAAVLDVVASCPVPVLLAPTVVAG